MQSLRALNGDLVQGTEVLKSAVTIRQDQNLSTAGRRLARFWSLICLAKQ